MIDGRKSWLTVVGFLGMFAWAMAFGLYDAIIIHRGDQSISNFTMNLAHDYPIVGVLFGFHAGILVGHLFAPQKYLSKNPPPQ